MGMMPNMDMLLQVLRNNGSISIRLLDVAFGMNSKHPTLQQQYSMFMAAATTSYQKTHHRHQDTISTNLTLQVITRILNILIIEPIMDQGSGSGSGSGKW